MTLEVIGVGFGRTGTLSLKLALEQLGFSSCYHMRELFAHPGHAETWTAMAKGEPPDWPSLYKSYRSAVDWPTAYFWRELIEYYPKAKILLTLRDPEKWYDSMAGTIFTAISGAYPDGATEPQLPDEAPEIAKSQIICGKTIISDKVFQGRFSDKQHCISIYNEHNAAVQRTVPADRLLVLEVKDGWAPLCKHLGVPEPDTPFPKSNSKEEFLRDLGKP
jgi:hypothetical protein